jgi:hypothetical protein
VNKLGSRKMPLRKFFRFDFGLLSSIEFSLSVIMYFLISGTATQSSYLKYDTGTQGYGSHYP